MRLPQLKVRANPIVIKELRSRMRGPRAFVILTGYLVLLGAFAYGLYAMITATNGLAGAMPLGAVVGRSVFIGLAFFELMLVCLIAPALTAGTVSGEQERRTLDLLLATPLRPASILWGKLLSALTYVFLLLLAAIPMASMAFVFGGLTAWDIVQVLLALSLFAVTYGTLGLFFSTQLRRTGWATVASYATLLLLMFGTYFGYIFYAAIRQGLPPRAFLIANPIAALASVLAGDMRPDTAGALAGPLLPLTWVLGGGLSLQQLVDRSVAAPTVRPLWHYTAGIHLIAGALLFMASVRALRPIRRGRTSVRRRLAWAAATVVVAAGLYALYGPPSYARLGQPALSVQVPTPIAADAGQSVTVPARPVMAEPARSIAPTATPVPTPEPSPSTTP